MRNRVLYPVGTINGRDHQMWPTLTRNELILLNGGTPGNPDDERAIDSVYPVGVSLDIIMKWMWRVREWTVAPSALSASGNIFDVPTAGNVGVWDMDWTTPEILLHTRVRSIEGDEDSEHDAFDEADMLGPWHNHPVAGDYIPESDPPEAWWKTLRNMGILGGTGIDVAGEGFVLGDYVLRDEPDFPAGVDFQDSDFLTREMNMTFSGGYVMFDPDTQLFYPPISLLLEIGISSQSGFQDVFFRAEILPATPPSDPESHDISLGEMEIVGLGEAVIIPIGRKGVRSPTDDEAALGLIELAGSFNLTVTANQFWPYRTRAGDPVYDETTGEELEDPFS